MEETEGSEASAAASELVVVAGQAEWRFTTQQASSEGGAAKGGGKINGPDQQTHRVARLFVAGEFPDKNLVVTEADLDGLIARFHANGARRPVQIEHIVGPLDPLGEVVGLHRCGPELFGLLVFSAGVEAHLQKRGVENVSVALVRENEAGGFSLKEVSLVLKGRIPSATLLQDEAGRLPHPTSGADSVYVAGKGNESAADKMARFRAAGKLTPATEPLAALLLSARPSQAKGQTAAPLTFGANGGPSRFRNAPIS